MRTALMELFISAVFVLLIIIVSGCKSEEESMLDEGMKKFENADFETAAKIYSDIIKKDSSNYDAYIKLASVNVCITSNRKNFYQDLFKAVNSREVLKTRFRDLISAFKFIDTVETPREYFIENFLYYQFSKDGPTGRILNETDEISAFNNIIKNHPDNPKLYFSRGMWHYVLRRQQEAVNDFAKAVQLDKNFLAALIMKGKAEEFYFGPGYYLSNYTRARLISIFDFRRALRLDPKNSDLMEKIGSAYSRLKLQKGSTKYFTMALQINPANTYVLLQKASTETISGDYKSAIEDYKILVNKYPDNANYLIELAGKRIFAGQDKEALADLEKAKKLAKYEGQINLIESIIKKNRLKK